MTKQKPQTDEEILNEAHDEIDKHHGDVLSAYIAAFGIAVAISSAALASYDWLVKLTGSNGITLVILIVLASMNLLICTTIFYRFDVSQPSLKTTNNGIARFRRLAKSGPRSSHDDASAIKLEKYKNNRLYALTRFALITLTLGACLSAPIYGLFKVVS